MTSAKRKEGKIADDSPIKKLKKGQASAEGPKRKGKKSQEPPSVADAAPPAEVEAAEGLPKKKVKQPQEGASALPSIEIPASKKSKKTKQAPAADIAPKAKKRIKPEVVRVVAASADIAGNDGPKDVDMADLDEAGLTRRQSGKKRRRKSKADDEANLPTEEQQRRQRQRELRDLALSMRAGGKKYIRPKKRQATEEAKAMVGKASTGKQATKASEGAGIGSKEESGSRPTDPVQIIVVPIYWNRKPEEKAEVVQAAQQIVDLITAAGIQVGMDTTNALSPGQKYAHWEGKGVKVRVEIGPKDVAKSECVLAVVTTPGELAQKQTLKLGPPLLRAAAVALAMELPASVLDQAASHFPAQRAKPTTAPTAAKESSKMAVDPQPAAGTKHTLASGDDLGGDFADLTFGEDETAGRRKKKSKRLVQ